MLNKLLESFFTQAIDRYRLESGIDMEGDDKYMYKVERGKS